jgi:hypothetical protein
VGEEGLRLVNVFPFGVNQHAGFRFGEDGRSALDIAFLEVTNVITNVQGDDAGLELEVVEMVNDVQVGGTATHTLEWIAFLDWDRLGGEAIKALDLDATEVIVQPVLARGSADEELGWDTTRTGHTDTACHDFQSGGVFLPPHLVHEGKVDVRAFPGAGFVYTADFEKRPIAEDDAERRVRLPGFGFHVAVFRDDLAPGNPAAEFEPEGTLEVRKVRGIMVNQALGAVMPYRWHRQSIEVATLLKCDTCNCRIFYGIISA